MSSNDLPESSPAHQTYLAAKRSGGHKAATEICIKHGSKSGSFPDIPSRNLPVALIDLQALADNDGGSARASYKSSESRSLDTAEIYAKWNERRETA